MKKKIFLALAAAACLGLLFACGDGDDGKKVTKYKVTFYKNDGTDKVVKTQQVEKGKKIGTMPSAGIHKEGSSEYSFVGWYDNAYGNGEKFNAAITEDTSLYAKWTFIGTATVKFDSNVAHPNMVNPANVTEREVTDGKVGPLPTTNPALKTGWDAGAVLNGWSTAASGGTVVTADTPVTSKIFTVYAQWDFSPGELTEADNIGTIIAPETWTNQGDGGTQGTWNGTGNMDGSFTYQGGAIRTMFPEGEIEDYDFVKVDYIHQSAAGTNMGIILKQGSTGVDFMSNEGNLWPTLANSGSFNFFIRRAGYEGNTAGIAFQRNNNGGTTKFTKLTFTKGVRRVLTFDLDYPEGEEIPDGYGVVGQPLIILPVPEPRDGYNFTGWYDGSTQYTATTVIQAGAAVDLKAKWKERVVVTTLSVDLSSANVTAVGATINTATAGVLDFTRTAAYQGAYVRIKVTLKEEAMLADYDRFTFTLEQEETRTPPDEGELSDSPWYKKTGVLAAQTFDGVTVANMGPGLVTETPEYGNGGEVSFDLAIIKTAAAASLQGNIELIIYTHSPAGIKTIIKDLVIVKD
jgi:uncharacterized repeat protein (TIGR02543 family)